MNGGIKAMAVMAALCTNATVAADWPGIYGPNRDNTSSQTGLLRSWPADGPKVLWTARVNAGFGGPAVAGGKVYLVDRDERVGDTLRVLDFATGRQLWTYGYDAPGKFMFAGSRTTPAIDGELVYISGPLGDLHAINTTTQKPVWRKNIWKEFGGGELPRWAVVQNPLIYRDLLVVAPQTPDVGVVAYDKLTGALKWKSAPLSGTAGYVSPAIVKVGDEDHVVQVMAWSRKQRGSVNGLDPLTGKVLWTYSGWQCGIPAPLPVDAGQNRMLVTGGYDAGAAMIQIAKNADGTFAVTELFKNPDFGAHTQPPILFQDHFYAHYTVNNRSDGLVAMTMDGQVKWKTDQKPPFVRGGSVLAEGLLLATDGNTKLYLIEPDPTAFKPLASATILEPGDNWAPLALVDGTLLVRGQKQLKALQVAR